MLQRGKTAIVTGAAQGIGFACAKRLADDGYAVIAVDHNADSGQRAADEIGARFVRCDIASETDVGELAAAVESAGRAGGHDCVALVHAAGITHRPVPPEMLSVEEYRRILDVDLIGTFLVCRAIAPLMTAPAAIVTVGSSTATAVLPLHAYGPAKAGVVGLSRQLAIEWGGRGIRVNCISPGYVLSPTLQDAFDRGLRSREKLESVTPERRVVEPSEIAAVAAFLVSADASGITGQNINVDAGFGIGAHWGLFDGVR